MAEKEEVSFILEVTDNTKERANFIKENMPNLKSLLRMIYFFTVLL